MQNKLPNIFEYLDIHIYLKDYYTFRKTSERDFSYDSWSKELGIKSRSYLRLVVIGKRTLTESVLPLFIQSLKLNADEIQYISLLIKFSGAENHQLKQSYGQQLSNFWRKDLEQIPIQDLTPFLQDSLLPVLFTYFSYPTSSPEVSKIAAAFGVETQRVHNCIKVLLKEGLIELVSSANESYKFKTTSPFFKVSDNPGNELLTKFHMEGLEQAKASHNLPFELRRFKTLLFALNSEQMLKAQELINEFAKQILKSFESESVKHKRIYRLNMQLFPISEQLEIQTESQQLNN